jgi:hypothetical protein
MNGASFIDFVDNFRQVSLGIGATLSSRLRSRFRQYDAGRIDRRMFYIR